MSLIPKKIEDIHKAPEFVNLLYHFIHELELAKIPSTLKLRVYSL